jgi:hypothetical protein
MTKKRLIEGLTIFFLLALSLRGLFLSRGQIGHNWDFSFPFPKEIMANVPTISLYTWWDFSLGQPIYLTIIHLVPNLLLAGLNSLIGPILSTRILIVGLLFTSYFSMNLFLKLIVKSKHGQFIAAILYAFSPFLFNDIIGGSWYMWFSYSLVPLLFLSGAKYLEEGRQKWLFPYLIFSSLVLSSLQNFILIHSALLLFLAVRLKTELAPNGKASRLLIYSFLFFLLNSYWISPFLFQTQSFFQSAGQQIVNSNQLSAVANNRQTILNIFTLTGYWDRNMYQFSLPSLVWNLVFAISVSIWIYVIYQLLLNKETGKKLFSWVFLMAVFIFFVKGGNEPFGLLSMTIFNRVPGMGIFRSPQHMMVLPVFFTAPIIAILADSFINRRIYRSLLYLAVIIWISGWWINGDFGQKSLARQGRDHIDFFSLPPELVDSYRISEGDPLNHRILFVPAVFSPNYLQTPYQGQAQGGQPEYAYLKNPTFNSEFTTEARMVDEYFCGLSEKNPFETLVETNTLYLVQRTDINPQFTNCSELWNHSAVTKKLESLSGLTQVIKGEYASLYKLDDSYFNPVINIEKVSEKMTVEYKKINPTKYRVVVHNSSPNITINLLTTYNPLWKMYLKPHASPLPPAVGAEFVSEKDNGIKQNNNLSNGGLMETVVLIPLDFYSQHKKVFGYANQWQIKIGDVCEQYDACPKNQDENYDFEIVISFSPQTYLYLGLSVSLVTLIGLIIFTAIQYKK